MFSLLIYQQLPHKFCGTGCSLRIHIDGLILDGKKEEGEREERKKEAGTHLGS